MPRKERRSSELPVLDLIEEAFAVLRRLPFAAWVEAAFGVRVEVMTDEGIEASAARLDANTLAIVSVSAEIRYPERASASRGGHLILLHGRDDGGVWFHNPSGIAPYQSDAWLPYATVARFHARRGMALTRPR